MFVDIVRAIKMVFTSKPTAVSRSSHGGYSVWRSGDVGVYSQNPAGRSSAAWAVRNGFVKSTDYLWIIGKTGYIGFIDKLQKIIVVLRRGKKYYEPLRKRVRGGWKVKYGQPLYFDEKKGKMVYRFYEEPPASLFDKKS